MTIEDARRVMAALETAGKALSDLGETIRKMEDAEMRRRLLRTVGDQMASLYVDIMRPIIKVYPELDPDKDLLES